MERPEQPKTPNLDKLKKLQPTLNDIVLFLDFLPRQPGGKAALQRVKSGQLGLKGLQSALDPWLAKFYGVDLDAVAVEQKANVQWAADMMAYRLRLDGGNVLARYDCGHCSHGGELNAGHRPADTIKWLGYVIGLVNDHHHLHSPACKAVASAKWDDTQQALVVTMVRF